MYVIYEILTMLARFLLKRIVETPCPFLLVSRGGSQQGEASHEVNGNLL
jgi:hypothetical protein